MHTVEFVALLTIVGVYVLTGIPTLIANSVDKGYVTGFLLCWVQWSLPLPLVHGLGERVGSFLVW